MRKLDRDDIVCSVEWTIRLLIVIFIFITPFLFVTCVHNF